MGPGYLDAFYYVDVARQLAAGHGLNVPFVWAYLEVGGHIPAVPLLPVPADAHWLPLASFIQVPFIWLLGPTGLASGLPFWLAGAAAAPLTYVIGLDAGLERWQALVGGALVAVPGAVTAYMAQPDNFGLYLFLGALALWLCGRGLAGDRRAFVVGGLVVGLASLARNDGILLGVPFGLAFLVERWRAWRAGGGVFATGPHRLDGGHRLCRGLRRGDGAVVPAPDRRLRHAAPVGRHRPHPVDHDLRPALQRHRHADPRLVPRAGAGPAAAEPAAGPGGRYRPLRLPAVRGGARAVRRHRGVAAPTHPGPGPVVRLRRHPAGVQQPALRPARPVGQLHALRRGPAAGGLPAAPRGHRGGRGLGRPPPRRLGRAAREPDLQRHRRGRRGRLRGRDHASSPAASSRASRTPVPRSPWRSRGCPRPTA